MLRYTAIFGIILAVLSINYYFLCDWGKIKG